MNIVFNNRKWMWTKEKWITSSWFIFTYEDIDKINELWSLFSIEIDWNKYDATISETALKPISVETENGTHKYKAWEADSTLNDVLECQIRLDIFINDIQSWILRTSEITLNY